VKRVTVPFFISHQGCPHTCVFCDQRAISGSRGLLPDRNELLVKIGQWSRSAGQRPLEVAFFGGTFTALERVVQQRLLAPLQSLLASGTISAVRISTRPDALDRETVQWLAGQGVAVIEVGVQSMDNQVLAAAGRGHDGEAAAAAIACIKACGLTAGAQLMPGLPGDTPLKALSSLQRVIEAGADFVRLYPALVLAGTELARLYVSEKYRPLSLDEGVTVCKQLLLMALKAGVDVIRIGLQADQGLTSGSILAGCWHPALGQLIYSELFHDLLIQLTTELSDGVPLTIRCHPGRVADVVGHSRKNLNRLARLGVAVKRVVADKTVSSLEVEVCSLNKCLKGSILNDLYY